MDPESKPRREPSIEAGQLRDDDLRDLQVLEAMSEAVIVLCMDGTIRRVNRGFERGTGWGREDAVGKTPVELGLMSEEEARKVETELLPRLMEKGVLRDIETTGIRRDGTSFIALMSWTLIRDSREEPSGIISVATDITERRRVEQELREFKNIVNRSPTLVFVWRVAPGGWPVEFVSDNVEQVLGYTADDFMSGRVSWPGITHPDDVPRLEAEVAGHIESKTMEWSQQYRLITRSGEIRWMSDRNLFLKDEKGDLARIQSIVVDITEQKKAEELLQTSKAKLEKAQRIASIATWEWDIATGEVTLTEEMREMYGMGPEEAGEPAMFEDLVKCVHPDDRPGVEERVQALLAGETSVPTEFRIVRPDGTERCLYGAGEVVFDEGGKPLKLFGTMQDITQQRQVQKALEESQDRYRQLFSAGTDAIVVFYGDDLMILDANEAAQELYGYTKEEFLELNVGDISAEPEKTAESIERMAAGDDSMIPLRWHRKKDGAVFPVEISPGAFSLKGRPVLCGIIRDITDRKRAEESLQRSEAELRAQTLALEQKNIAFKEIVQHIEEEKNMMRIDLSANVEELLMPVVEKLKMGADAGKYVDLLEHHLRELTSTFGRKIASKNLRLSSREIEICNLIRGGLRSKDIAELLNVSHQTVEKHRKNIRKKLGISSKDINLSSYLREL